MNIVILGPVMAQQLASMEVPKHNGCLFGHNKITHKCLKTRRQARRR